MRHLIFIFLLSFSLQSFGQSNGETAQKERYKNALIQGDIPSQKSIAAELITSYSSNELNYYRTLLKTTPNSAILVTNGLEDTYPVTILQHQESLKSNLTIVSLGLLYEEEYRMRLLNKFDLSTEFDKTSKSIYLSRFMKARIPLYVSTTVNPTTYQYSTANMFLVGLSLKYKTTNQYDQLESFWTNLKQNEKYKFILSSNEKGMYSNYLPPLLTLYKLKVESGQKDKKLKIAINYLAKILGKEKVVEEILKQYEKGG